MLAEYLPSRNRFYDQKTYERYQQMNKTHIERYSDKQVMKIDSFLCLLHCSLFYLISKYKNNA
jgi:hypothetical protein